jgi:succinyl-CoA synthetase beta subunit
MSTIDIVTYYGGRVANFLDGGGGASEQNVRTSCEILGKMSDEKKNEEEGRVGVWWINSFGGLTKTVSY